MVARRMLRTVQQGARPFFATMALEDSHRVRMGAIHYLKAGDPGITALGDAALAAASF